jgi:cysteine desulfurase/selenocysteine lyase
MNTPSSPFNFSDWGLPSEEEIAKLAAAYFPEFNAGGIPGRPVDEGTHGGAVGVGGIRDGLADAGGIRSELADPGGIYRGQNDIRAESPPAYSPVVLPRDGAEFGAAGIRRFPEGNRAQVRGEKPQAFLPRSLDSIRADFPILAEKVSGGQDLVWLDNAATTQRPRAVIDRLTYYYGHENSNVHRGAHELAERSTNAYEEARGKIARFIGAPSPDNIVYVRGTTEGINLVAQAYVRPLLRAGDEIILTMLEHHANIVPWQLIACETGAILRVAPVDQSGQIILSEYERLFNSRTRFVSATQVSNALGTITPVAELVQIAHAKGVRILIDGAQSVSHIPVNVSAPDADFFVFSGHKIFGPTGIGVLYGKTDVLEAARPYQGGGNMIDDVTFERTLYQKPPRSSRRAPAVLPTRWAWARPWIMFPPSA